MPNAPDSSDHAPLLLSMALFAGVASGLGALVSGLEPVFSRGFYGGSSSS